MEQSERILWRGVLDLYSQTIGGRGALDLYSQTIGGTFSEKDPKNELQKHNFWRMTTFQKGPLMKSINITTPYIKTFWKTAWTYPQVYTCQFYCLYLFSMYEYCVWVLVCMHVHNAQVHVCEQKHVYAHMWGSKIDIGCLDFFHLTH